jgi:hypothetical protein
VKPPWLNFAVELFEVLDYIRREQVARMRVDLPLFICGDIKDAKTWQQPLSVFSIAF